MACVIRIVLVIELLVPDNRNLVIRQRIVTRENSKIIGATNRRSLTRGDKLRTSADDNISDRPN